MGDPRGAVVTKKSENAVPDSGTASSFKRPASFAGMNQIRFGGSVASATLSAHWALPGGDFQLPCDPSTAADSAVGSGRALGTGSVRGHRYAESERRANPLPPRPN